MEAEITVKVREYSIVLILKYGNFLKNKPLIKRCFCRKKMTLLAITAPSASIFVDFQPSYVVGPRRGLTAPIMSTS